MVENMISTLEQNGHQRMANLGSRPEAAYLLSGQVGAGESSGSLQNPNAARLIAIIRIGNA